MFKMMASDFEGLVEIDSEEDLLCFLKKRPALNANHFQLTFDQVPGYLDVLVKGSDCAIYYLDDPAGVFVSYGCGYKSTVHSDDEQDEAFITFYFNACGEPLTVPRYYLIGAESMEKAAIEFSHTQARPMCIDWDDL